MQRWSQAIQETFFIVLFKLAIDKDLTNNEKNNPIFKSKSFTRICAFISFDHEKTTSLDLILPPIEKP